MKTKDLTIAAIFIAAILVQSFALFSFPITLTYALLYFLTKQLKNKKLPFLAVLVFVIVKNIIMPALMTTIIFDLIGLMIFISVCLIQKKLIVYLLIPITIVFHLLLLDLSTVILTVNIITNLKDLLMLLGSQISLGFIAYIYAPLSIIIILVLDGINYLTDLNFDE